MAKEVFVEDEDGEGGGASMEGMSEGDLLKELHRRCAYLEKINKVRNWILFSMNVLL